MRSYFVLDDIKKMTCISVFIAVESQSQNMLLAIWRFYPALAKYVTKK